jgi:hypothetical protein
LYYLAASFPVLFPFCSLRWLVSKGPVATSRLLCVALKAKGSGRRKIRAASHAQKGRDEHTESEVEGDGTRPLRLSPCPFSLPLPRPSSSVPAGLLPPAACGTAVTGARKRLLRQGTGEKRAKPDRTVVTAHHRPVVHSLFVSAVDRLSLVLHVSFQFWRCLCCRCRRAGSSRVCHACCGRCWRCLASTWSGASFGWSCCRRAACVDGRSRHGRRAQLVAPA